MRLVYICAKIDFMFKQLFFFVLLFLGCGSMLFAQSSALVDTIQVSSTRIPLAQNQTGRSIQVLTSEDIANTNAQSLDEVLQTVCGVELQSRGGFGTQGDILMRGSTFTQVLILVDGMRINDPLTGHFNSYIPVAVGQIHSIEILRGAASAAYGADAVGGVINVRTHTFVNQSKKNQSIGDISYGEHNLVVANQGFSWNKGKLKLGAGFSSRQSTGEEILEKTIDTSTILEAYNTFFDIQTVGASLAYELTDRTRIKAFSSFDHRDFDARYFYTTSTFDKSTEIVGNWFNRVQIERINDKGVTDINASYKHNTDEFVFSPDFPSTNNHTSRFLNVTANHLQYINDQWKIMGGLQTDKRSIESNDRGDHEDWHFGGYAMSVLARGAMTSTLSMRLDYDENYGLQFSPGVNVAYSVNRLVARLSVGKSIRAADYTERYVSNNLMNLTPGRSLGNPDLLAESSWSTELGVDYQLNQHWSINSTLFVRTSSQLIDYVSTNENEIGSVSEIGSLQEGADYFFARNVSSVNTNGIELSFNYNQKIMNDVLVQCRAGYTFINTNNEDDVISVYLSSHARHLFSSQFNLHWQRFSIGINSLFKERNPAVAAGIDETLNTEYWLFNSKLGFEISKNAGIHFEVRNIADVRYQNILGAQMPGRWMLGGIHWSF